jgi:hypothetical protein
MYSNKGRAGFNRRTVAAVAVAAMAFAMVTTAAPAAPVAAVGPRGQFTSVCSFDHRLPDDPIVAPGRPGGSHMHDFFANKSTNAMSTAASLDANTSTSCQRVADQAAYWTPAVLENGQVVQPVVVRTYYRVGVNDPSTVQAFPAHLRMIAGNSGATAAQPVEIVSWACSVTGDEIEVTEVPNCGAALLRMRVVFPDCWNGRDLDSADHKSHMAYSVSGQCPSTHPVPVPKLTYSIRYRVTDYANLTLSSGGTYSGHGDFFNEWDQRSLVGLVRSCLASGLDCGTEGGPRGTVLQPLST